MAERPAEEIVLLDTNAVLLAFTSGVDLVGEVARLRPGATVCVPTTVLGELDRLAARATPFARAAAELARRLPSIPAPGRGDASIAALARRLGAAVVTADRALRDRLSADGIPVLYPRGPGRLSEYPRAVRRVRSATVKNAPPVRGPTGGRRRVRARRR